jgi:peptidoglycan-associated lipoprotein
VASEVNPPEEPSGDGGSRDILPLSEEEWFRSAALAELQAKLSDVHFDYDRDELRSDALASIRKNHEWLAKPYNNLRVELEGHCDERGPEGYNLALGDRRAVAVEGYLRSLGFPYDRLRTISYGKERPQCRDSAEQCWWRNRRVHFRVVRGEAQGSGK